MWLSPPTSHSALFFSPTQKQMGQYQWVVACPVCFCSTRTYFSSPPWDLGDQRPHDLVVGIYGPEDQARAGRRTLATINSIHTLGGGGEQTCSVQGDWGCQAALIVCSAPLLFQSLFWLQPLCCALWQESIQLWWFWNYPAGGHGGAGGLVVHTPKYSCIFKCYVCLHPLGRGFCAWGIFGT